VRARHHAPPDWERLRAVVRQAPDHYAILDGRLIGRLAGFLFCCAGLLAGVLLAIEPPTAAFGAMGWVPAAIIVGLALTFGAGMVANPRILGAGALMAIALSGPLMLGTLQWLAGSGSSYVQLLILSMMWSAVVLPARRLLVLLLADTIVVFLPVAYGQWSSELLSERIATLGIAWTLAVLGFGWSSRLRNVRRTLEAERAAADDLARVDALTGLGNRRALDEAFVAQLALANRTGRPIAALVGDLDGFKRINDIHGHQTGDRILREVAAVLRDVVRRTDVCFRWGGDEFVVLLPELDDLGARDVAARIGAAVRDRCTTPDGMPVSLTLGAAAHMDGSAGVELLADADGALPAAKAGGAMPALR
jgi:diguanylate cyclase (GGDEF)-like protein